VDSTQSQLPDALTWPESDPEYSQQSHTTDPLEQMESAVPHFHPEVHFAACPVSAAQASKAAVCVQGLLAE